MASSGKEVLTRDCKELKKETYIYIYVMYVYKTTKRFNSAGKYKVIKLLTSGCHTNQCQQHFY